MNTPFKETDKLKGQSVKVSSYLKYGCILKAAFNYINKNHKVRAKNNNCMCCVCTSSFSPEDLELIFLENVCSNPKVFRRKENFHKIKNLLSCIDRNALMFYKKKSCILIDIFKKVESLPRLNTDGNSNGKRKNEYSNSNTKSAKHPKIHKCKESNETIGISRDKSKGKMNHISKQKGFVEAKSPYHVRTIEDDVQFCVPSPKNKRFLSQIDRGTNNCLVFFQVQHDWSIFRNLLHV